MVRVLERGLRAHGFELTVADSSDVLASLAADESVGIAVVDLAPDGRAGRRLVDQLRASRPTLPMLLLVTSDELASVPPGDEYLTKPFAMEELIARIHARTRAAGDARQTTLTAGNLRLDLLARCAWRGDRLIDLPTREFALLEYFMRHPRRVLSRQEILADVWGYHMHHNASNSNIVDVYVRYLRNRLHAAGDRSLIATVRGEGYQFNPPVETTEPSAAGTRRNAPRRARSDNHRPRD